MPGISKCIGRISVLLDYYPSAQFAGIHLANRTGLFAKRGLDLKLIPPPGAGGDEPQLVCNMQQAFDKKDGGCLAVVPNLAIGTVEQNVLIPAVARGVASKAFATIFQRSPLALGALPGTKLDCAADMGAKTIGMHVDSIELMNSLISMSGVSARVTQVERAQKVQELIAGKVDAIQLYDCMEAIELRHILGETPSVLRLSDIAMNAPSGRAIPLGYSQVIFGAKWALRPPPARAALAAFLEACAEGWTQAQANPGAAAAAILEDRAEHAVQTGTQVDVEEFQKEALERCLPYVLSSDNEKIGSINPQVWQEAAYAMALTGYSPSLVPQCNSLDPTIWEHSPTKACTTQGNHDLITDGIAVSASMRDEAQIRAGAFEMRVGRKPSLAIISVGAGHLHGSQRKNLFAQDERSWFNKSALCKGVGITPIEIHLPENASFGAVHDAIQSLNQRADVDAIILQRPVPATLDADVLGSYISAEKDVDDERRSSGYGDGGEMMASQGIFQAAPDMQLDAALKGSDELLARPPAPAWLCKPAAVLPCTVVGVLHLLHRSSLIDQVCKGFTVVVGRSPQLGAPLARELIKANATVAVCHSNTEKEQLKELCLRADTLVVAAGSPGLISKDMVKKGALVINCGTTFCPDSKKLLPDVNDDVKHVARCLTPTPHGVGPTCAAALTLNTLTLAEAAARRRDLEIRHKLTMSHDLMTVAQNLSDIPMWSRDACKVADSPIIRRVFTRASYSAAAQLILDMTVLAERANHHPSFSMNPSLKCEQEGGCDVVVELSTYSKKAVTIADVALAQRFDTLV